MHSVFFFSSLHELRYLLTCGLLLPAVDLHFTDGGPLTVLYLLCVDSINFCFWPQRGLEYEQLARGLKVHNADHMHWRSARGPQGGYTWPIQG